MMEIFDVLNQVPYLYEALQLIIAGHALALAIVNMTNTPADDKLVGQVYKYIEFLAGIVKPAKAKQPPPNKVE